MELKDLKTNVIYQTYWGNPNKPTIFTLRKNGKDTILHYMYESRTFSFDSIHSSLNGSIPNVTLATREQKQWYNACLKARAFVKFKDINLIHELWT